MPERTFTSGYRYGFGGQETDKEANDNSNIYTADYWEYDARLGRRWNIDPVVKPWESPYAAFSNNPIIYSDPSGANASDPKLDDLMELGGVKLDYGIDHGNLGIVNLKDGKDNNPPPTKTPPPNPKEGDIWNYPADGHTSQYQWQNGQWVGTGMNGGDLKTVEIEDKKGPSKWEKFKTAINDLFDVGVSITGGGGSPEKPISNTVNIMPKHILEISYELWEFLNCRFRS